MSEAASRDIRRASRYRRRLAAREPAGPWRAETAREAVERYRPRVVLMALSNGISADRARAAADDVLAAAASRLASSGLREGQTLADHVHDAAARVVDTEEDPGVPWSTLLLEDGVVEPAEVKRVGDALRRDLTARERLVMLLLLVEGLSAAEVAERLGVPVHEVAVAHVRAFAIIFGGRRPAPIF
jgi:hypothetical protein